MESTGKMPNFQYFLLTHPFLESNPLARREELVPSQQAAKTLPSRTKMQARIAMSAPLLRLTGRT